MSNYTLIYGVKIKQYTNRGFQDDYPDIKTSNDPPTGLPDGIELFTTNMYNKPLFRFIGYRFEILENMYEKPYICKGRHMQLACDSYIPDWVKEYFANKDNLDKIRKKYGIINDVDIYALLQNVYTTHYASGQITYGYYLIDDEFTDNEYNIMYECDDYIIKGAHDNDNSCTVGIELNSIDPEDNNQIANFLTKHYEVTDELIVGLEEHMEKVYQNCPFLNGKTKVGPYLMFVPTMCHCCT